MEPVFQNKSCYSAVTASPITIPTATGQTVLLAIFAGPACGRDIRLLKPVFSTTGGSGGRYEVKLMRITALTAGTDETIVLHDTDDPASVATVKSSATVVAGGVAQSYLFPGGPNTAFPFDNVHFDEGKPFIAKARQMQGWALVVNVVQAMTTSQVVEASFTWVEENTS
jgi:hypothetical protein